MVMTGHAQDKREVDERRCKRRERAQGSKNLEKDSLKYYSQYICYLIIPGLGVVQMFYHDSV